MTEDALFEYNLSDVIFFCIYIFAIVVISNRSFIKRKKYFKLFILISVEHIFFTIIYYLYTFYNRADSISYYNKTKYLYQNWEDTFGQGTHFIHAVVYPFVQVLNLSYLGCFFVFSLIGLLAFDKLLKIIFHLNKGEWTNWNLLLLLPNVHFWTVAIGKDSLIFYGLVSIAYCVYFNRSLLFYVIPLLLVGFIRIHILSFILVAFLIRLIFLSQKISKLYKGVIIASFIGLFVVIMPFIQERLGITEDVDVQDRIEQLQMANQAGGSSINLSDSNIVVKLLSFLFRPLFIDAHNFMALILSLENALWVLMFYKIYRLFSISRSTIVSRTSFWFYLISIFTISIPSAHILTNLGIATRQKTMIFPFVIITLIILINSVKIVKSSYNV